jgi:hypothetical protein
LMRASAVLMVRRQTWAPDPLRACHPSTGGTPARDRRREQSAEQQQRSRQFWQEACADHHTPVSPGMRLNRRERRELRAATAEQTIRGKHVLTSAYRRQSAEQQQGAAEQAPKAGAACGTMCRVAVAASLVSLGLPWKVCGSMLRRDERLGCVGRQDVTCCRMELQVSYC